MRSDKKDYLRKFLWSSVDFNDWIREQSEALKKNGFNIEPSEVTHRLFHDVIKPSGFMFVVPKKLGGNGKFPRKPIF